MPLAIAIASLATGPWLLGLWLKYFLFALHSTVGVEVLFPVAR